MIVYAYRNPLNRKKIILTFDIKNYLDMSDFNQKYITLVSINLSKYITKHRFSDFKKAITITKKELLEIC